MIMKNKRDSEMLIIEKGSMDFSNTTSNHDNSFSPSRYANQLEVPESPER